MVLSMDRWRGKVAIVTGASAGIGAAIVQQLVEEGLQVVGLARRVDVIEELAQKLHGKKGKLYAVKADMSKEEDILAAINWVKENLGCAHILINNAGLSKHNTLIGGDPKKWKEVFDVNVIGLCVATGAVSKDMIDNNINGHIIHINSIAGHTVYNMPGTNCYSASKYAVTALTETLRNEINELQSKIKITSVSPGAVKTDFAKTSGRLDDPVLKERMDKLPKLLAEDCADAVLYALSTPPHVQGLLKQKKLERDNSWFGPEKITSVELADDDEEIGGERGHGPNNVLQEHGVRGGRGNNRVRGGRGGHRGGRGGVRGGRGVEEEERKPEAELNE